MRLHFRLLLLSLILLSSCIKDEFYNKKGNNIENFNLLWEIIDESYCYFDYKQIDWDSIYSIYRPQISNNLTKYDFFKICGNMLFELKDGHVRLSSDFNAMSYSDFYLGYPQNFNSTIIERTYLAKDYINANKLKAKNIRGVGYIRYGSFMNMISSRNLKEAIIQLGDIKGLIIDVRDNTGGSIAMVDTIVSNFCKSDIISGYVRNKTGKGHNDFTDYLPNKIKAKSEPVYDGNIVVLTNRLVYSAANDFVSAMKCLDNVTLIGDRTGGGGGAPFTSELYNGWKVINSRNPLYNKDKQHIEFGIEPDIKIDMDKEQEANGIDSILEFAIDYLSGHN